METIFLFDAAMTLVLLVVHLADYFMVWPPQPLTVGQSDAPLGGPGGIAGRPLPDAYSYDRAA